MEKIFINSDKNDEVYDLSDLIPQMMKAENVSKQFCIDFFMNGLDGDRYRIFPEGTTAMDIVEWALNESLEVLR